MGEVRLHSRNVRAGRCFRKKFGTGEFWDGRHHANKVNDKLPSSTRLMSSATSCLMRPLVECQLAATSFSTQTKSAQDRTFSCMFYLLRIYMHWSRCCATLRGRRGALYPLRHVGPRCAGLLAGRRSACRAAQRCALVRGQQHPPCLSVAFLRCSFSVCFFILYSAFCFVRFLWLDPSSVISPAVDRCAGYVLRF